jgi:hypothetical protein
MVLQPPGAEINLKERAPGCDLIGRFIVLVVPE